jgi:hypothetical protein
MARKIYDFNVNLQKTCAKAHTKTMNLMLTINEMPAISLIQGIKFLMNRNIEDLYRIE